MSCPRWDARGLQGSPPRAWASNRPRSRARQLAARHAAGWLRPLAREFSLVDREVNLLGRSREEALEHLGQRCRSQDVSAFTAQLMQAVSQGSSLTEGLAVQAALARETAQAEAMERIRKMPTKLDIVLSLCFLPPTVALVVVPTVVNLLNFLNDSMG